MNLEKKFNFGKKLLLGAAVSAALSFGACGKDGVVDPNGTGVKGLNTPSEILSNPYVKDAIQEARDEGLNVTPETGINPPVISGTYNLNGTAYFPMRGQLASGTWVWSRQTSDNHINTDYDQGLQIGANVEGEIIRGTGSQFTVYSILEISQSGYRERAAIIVDGRQGDQGNVSAIYIGTGVRENSQIVSSGGTLELTLRGAATSAGKVDGAYLVGLVRDALNKN